MISRYPGQEIRWQEIDNNRPFRIPIGPVTGYRSIDQWIDTSGRVTRTFNAYEGSDRTYSEIYLNYLDTLKQEGFEVIGKGLSDDRRGPDVGSRSWLEVYNIENPFRQPGEVGWY